MTTDILIEAETIVRDIAEGVTTPHDHECLLCFVHRELAEFGCDETLRFARRYRDLAAPRATALEARLGDVGGFCDCEVFLNGYAVASRFWSPSREIVRDGYIEIVDPEPPATAPPCTGVRKGSTRPCSVWQRAR